MLASASSVCKCAVVVLTVHVSLWSRLFCGRKNDKKEESEKIKVVVVVKILEVIANTTTIE